MKLRVLFFSVLRDVTGTDGVDLELPDESQTVAGLLSRLFERWPMLRDWDGSLLVAVDQRYARRDAALHDGAEVAVMPPVQGG